VEVEKVVEHVSEEKTTIDKFIEINVLFKSLLL
jgi:hypothetical protein